MIDLLIAEKVPFNNGAVRLVATKIGIDTEFREINELVENIEVKHPDIAQALQNFINARNSWIDYSLELEKGKRNGRLTDAEANIYDECVKAREHTKGLLIELLNTYAKSRPSVA